MGKFWWPWNEGVLVKTGLDVLVSVRRAIGGTDLGQLHAAVEKEFLTLDEPRAERAIGNGEIGNRIPASLRDLQHEG